MSDSNKEYVSYQILTPPEIFDVQDALGTGWVFRGQEDATWDISSSLEREVNRLYKPDRLEWLENDVRSRFESITLKKIKSAHLFEPSIGQCDRDDFSWLALLQHHGCKTRMVDFTESFYFALYFAVRDMPKPDSPEQEAAVWAISTSSLNGKIASIRQEYGVKLSEEEVPRRLVNNSIGYPERYQNNDNFAIVYGKPQRMNQRMIAQQGRFLCPLNLEKSFMENLSIGLNISGNRDTDIKHSIDLNELRTRAQGEKVIKFFIPNWQNQHRKILSHLRKMNISDATLFPGLDGFVRSLNYYGAEGE